MLPEQKQNLLFQFRSLLGFLDGNAEFTPLEDRIGIIEKIKKYINITDWKYRYKRRSVKISISPFYSIIFWRKS